MWTASAVSGADPSRSLLLEHGFPSIYKTFLSNMQHEQLTDVVVPLPLPSKLASVVLKRLNVTADLIHVDAGANGVCMKLKLSACPSKANLCCSAPVALCYMQPTSTAV